MWVVSKQASYQRKKSQRATKSARGHLYCTQQNKVICFFLCCCYSKSSTTTTADVPVPMSTHSATYSLIIGICFIKYYWFLVCPIYIFYVLSSFVYRVGVVVIATAKNIWLSTQFLDWNWIYWTKRVASRLRAWILIYFRNRAQWPPYSNCSVVKFRCDDDDSIN